jgi:hypothetical protein
LRDTGTAKLLEAGDRVQKALGVDLETAQFQLGVEVDLQVLVC